MAVPLIAVELELYHQPSVVSKVALANWEQPPNAHQPMLVTLSGMVMLVKPVQPSNAQEPMLVTLFPMVTPVKPVQS